MGVYGPGVYGTDVYGSPPPVDNTPNRGSRIAWIFFDGTVTHELTINPDSVSKTDIGKKVTSRMTSAGKTVNFEGRRDPQKISFSGTILLEEQFRSMNEWVSKKKQIRITDDLGQNMWVYLVTFSPTRQHDNTYPWHMSYSVDGFVLDRA